MEINTIDNSFRLSQSILWQYDHAPNLIGMFQGIGEELKLCVSDFWDWFAEKVADVDKAEYFGLNVLGITLGVPRPFIPHGQGEEPGHVEYSEGEPRPLSDDVYRRVLKARMYMLDADASCSWFAEGLKIAFEGRVGCVDGGCDTNHPMAMFVTNNLADAIPAATYYCFDDGDGGFVYGTTSNPSSGASLYRDMNGVFTLADVTFDPETMTRSQDGDVNVVTADTPYLVEPTAANFPNAAELALRLEEYDLLSNQDIFESIFQYPAGVRTDGGEAGSDKVIGLNESQATGQNLRNFSPVHAEASDESVNGGQFAISEGLYNV